MITRFFIFFGELIGKRASAQGKRKFFSAMLLPAISVLFTAFFSGCASNSDLDPIRGEVNQLKGDASELRKETSEMRGDIRALKGQVSLAAKEESFNALRESQANIYSQVSDYSKDIQVLKGRFDEYRFFIDKTLKESSVEKELLRSQINSLEGRVKDLTEKLARLSETKPPAPAQKPAAENGLSAEKAQEAKEPADDPAKAYEEAYKMFKEKKYGDAREKFGAFIKKFPKDELAGNAHFWIAESHYAEKDFESAILAYETLIKDYADNRKAPAAFLKQGMSFIEIGDKKTAKVIFERLIEKYPDSVEADKAREKMAEMDKKMKKPKKQPPIQKQKNKS